MTQRPNKKKKAQVPSTHTSGGSLVEHSPVSGRGLRWSLVLFAVLVAGCFLRALALDMKPPHFDEGINGHFVAKMWKDGYYHYDPTNFHGPLYFYFLLLAELIFGRTIVGYRFITGLISFACVLLIAKHRRFFGAAASWAAVVCALSVGFVFYSRYAIHESLFIFFQVLFSYGWFTWKEERSRRAVAMLSVAFFGLFCVKETFFIFVGIWFIAVAMNHYWAKFKTEAEMPVALEAGTGFWRAPATSQDWIALFGFGALATVILFTGFFINHRGFEDMFTSLMFWTKTGSAGKSGHEKPFMYWLDLLYLYEWPALIGLAVSAPLFFLSRARVRIMCLVGFGASLAYSIIPYKTPWLILNLVWPLAFVFGAALDFATGVRMYWVRWGFRFACLIALSVMVQTMVRLNFKDYANEKEKYVYVQSTNQMKKVLDFIEERVRKNPEDINMKVFALVRDPWPLPWVFSLYPNLIYGKPPAVDVKDAGVILIDHGDQAVLESQLKGKYWRVQFQIRDSYEQGFAYLEFERFKGIVPSDSALVGIAATGSGASSGTSSGMSGGTP